MRFADYIRQENPTKQFMVLVRRDECEQITKTHNGELVTLKVLGICYTYLKLAISRILYTMDEDGNRQSMSVFILED